jgi:hypothetical protein
MSRPAHLETASHTISGAIWSLYGQIAPEICGAVEHHSHSMVPGGFEVMS